MISRQIARLREFSASRRRTNDAVPLRNPSQQIIVKVVKGIDVNHNEIGEFITANREQQDVDARLIRKLSLWLKEKTDSDCLVYKIDNNTIGIKIRMKNSVVSETRNDVTPAGKEP